MVTAEDALAAYKNWQAKIKAVKDAQRSEQDARQKYEELFSEISDEEFDRFQEFDSDEFQ